MRNDSDTVGGAYRTPGNPGRYRPLEPEGIRSVHEATLKVLSEVGVSVPDPATGRVLKQAGAVMDEEGKVARIPPEVVEEKVKLAPSSVTLCGRDPSSDLVLCDGNVYFGTGGTALNVLDFGAEEARTAKIEDLVNTARLVDTLDNVHFFLLPTHPSDLDAVDVDVNRFMAGLTYTEKHVMGGIYTLEGAMKVVEIAERVAGSPEELRERPIISMITCMISPLKPDPHYTGMMVEIARRGIPVAVPAEPLCGATGPVTLAGNLVIQNADSLTGVVIAQSVNPGAPVIYGSVASSTNLRNMKYICGSVEMGLLNAAGAQMASFYGLPYYATAGATDSKVLDAQSSYESAISALMTALAGAHYIHDAAGLMEFAMTVSLEKYVIDNEILGMVMRGVKGIRVDEESLALEAIGRVGPGGSFISEPHTVRNMRREHYIPTLSDRKDRDDWLADGALDAAERAHDVVLQVLNAPERRYISDELAEDLRIRFPEIRV